MNELTSPAARLRRTMGIALACAAALAICLEADAETPQEYVVTPAPRNAAAVVVLERELVHPDHRYALTWSMKVEGEKQWRFRADFAGVMVSFTDEAGNPAGSVSRHTSCWQTADWRPAWVLFRTPEHAARITASFAIVSEEPLPGQFRVRDVRIEDLDNPSPPTNGNGILSIRAAEESGALMPARIYVSDPAGGACAPRFAYAYELGKPCFYLQDLALGRIEVLPGEYEIVAMKGFEYTVGQTWASVGAGGVTEVDIVLKRRFDLKRLGWVSGDHHTHLFRHGSSLYPMMNLTDVYNIAQAEGLDFLPFMGEDKVGPEQRSYAGPGFIGMATGELTRDLWGHICPIGVWEWPTVEEYGEAWPMNCDWIDAASATAGAIAYAHPYGPLRKEQELKQVADPEAGLIAREFPIDLALGEACTLDILAKEDAQGEFDLKVRDYMRLLSLGFRAGVSGSTDFHLDQGRQPIGGIRTYAHVNELTWPEVARAYREGRTFATNGPLLLVKANGGGPGDTVSVAGGESLACEVEAYSLWRISGVELWLNGELAAELCAQDGAVKQTIDLKPVHSGWLLAIAKGRAAHGVMSAPEGRPMVEGQYAITSPIYVDVPGSPQPMDTAAAEYFIRWVEAVQVAFNTECARMAQSGEPIPSERPATVLERLTRARAVFEEKAKGT